jgi:hypothetical protein
MQLSTIISANTIKAYFETKLKDCILRVKLMEQLVTKKQLHKD